MIRRIQHPCVLRVERQMSPLAVARRQVNAVAGERSDE